MADDFSDKLNSVLNDPEAMGQILSIAKSITGGGDAEAPEPSSTPALPQQMPDLSGIMGMLGGLSGGGGDANPLSVLGNLDPRIIQAGMRILSEYNHGDDRKVALLVALKPFLKEERASKIDRAVQVAKLSRIVRAALQMFKEGGESSDV